MTSRENDLLVHPVCHAFLSITLGVFRLFEIIAVQSNRSKWEKIGKTKTTLGTKTDKPLVFFTKTENQMLKNEKSANRIEHQNRKSEL